MTVEQPTDGLGAVIDVASWDRAAAERAAAYRTAIPFPHAVVDEVLRPEVLAAAMEEFPRTPDDTWTSYVHVNERKYGNPDPSTWGPTLQAIHEALSTPAFLSRLEALTGIDGLLADAALDGAGLHITPPGGHLNIHADFTAHHTQPTWRRRVNVLLYLNDGWEPGDGGELELWAEDMSRCEARVRPIANRMVVFSTSATSYHGHPEPLAGPADRPRRSMALYYFTEEHRPLRRATTYRALPGSGLHGVLVRLDNAALHVYDRVKRATGISDRQVSSVLRRFGGPKR